MGYRNYVIDKNYLKISYLRDRDLEIKTEEEYYLYEVYTNGDLNIRQIKGIMDGIDKEVKTHGSRELRYILNKNLREIEGIKFRVYGKFIEDVKMEIRYNRTEIENRDTEYVVIKVNNNVLPLENTGLDEGMQYFKLLEKMIRRGGDGNIIKMFKIVCREMKNKRY